MTVRIAQFGTFEVENFGDRLFPEIAARELGRRLGEIELIRFSPVEDAAAAVRPSRQDALAGALDDVDLILIGGGDVLSFHSRIAPFYDRGWKEPYSAHCACWALPTVLRPRGVPVIWNAAGVPHELNPVQAALVDDLFSEAGAVSVRDHGSLTRLRRAGVRGEIEIVPDTALLLADLHPRPDLLATAQAVLSPLGRQPGRTLVVQGSDALIGNSAAEAAAAVREAARRLDLSAVLLPVSGCHGDAVGLARIRDQSPTEFPLIDRPFATREIAAIIASAGAFVGTSLHGNIAAFGCGVPHLAVNPEGGLAKLVGFVDLIGRPDRCVLRWADVAAAADRIGPGADEESVRAALKARVAAHFDRIADVVRGARRSDSSAARAPLTPTEASLRRLRLNLLRNEAKMRGDVEQRLAAVQALVTAAAAEKQVLVAERAQVAQRLAEARALVEAGAAERRVLIAALEAHNMTLPRRLARGVAAFGRWLWNRVKPPMWVRGCFRRRA